MLPLELRVIRWGDRHYLLADSEIEDFRAAIRNGSEPKSSIEGESLLRHGDERLPAEGEPTLSEVPSSCLSASLTASNVK